MYLFYVSLVWYDVCLLHNVFMPFGFIAGKYFNYMTFQSFDFEDTWWRIFQKRVMRTKFDIYVFIFIYFIYKTRLH
jgi:hypothetical protein